MIRRSRQSVTRPLRGWRRFAAFSAIVALVFHAALLLVHTPAQAAEDGLSANSIVLCTSLGLKVVALADLSGGDAQVPADQTNQKTDQATLYECPICLSAQLAATALPPIDDIVLPRADIAVVVFAPLLFEQHPRTISHADSAPRAPPVPV
jgi:hypothetical protein